MPISGFSEEKYRSYCMEMIPPPCGIVVFGASGDLTHRKILPSLFRLFVRNLLPADFFVLGVARTRMSEEGFRDKTRESLRLYVADEWVSNIDEFIKHVFYLSGSYDEIDTYKNITQRLRSLHEKFSTLYNSIFYLATPPNLFDSIIKRLAAENLTEENNGYTRMVFEKPFGHDLNSACELNRTVHKYLDEKQIYRIDHYLGKETVQNIMMLRFANIIFEPIWNRQYIDHVQITAAESVGVEHRAGYYENAGCLRDMFQNHMMQILALVTQEPSHSFDADSVRDEKIKVLKAIRPFDEHMLRNDVIRGQYSQGDTGKAYVQEDGVDLHSRVETFVAMRLWIDNWRWKGVPFYIRSGKRLPRKVTEIVITFKRVPHSMFSAFSEDQMNPNMLVLNVQPEDGFLLNIQAKHPGPKLCMSTLGMDFRYRNEFDFDMPDAYERLLMDCMQGDQTLFIRSDTLQQTWGMFDPILDFWKKENVTPELYPAGTWGPKSADLLLKRDNRMWYI